MRWTGSEGVCFLDVCWYFGFGCLFEREAILVSYIARGDGYLSADTI